MHACLLSSSGPWPLLRNALDEARLDRQLGCRQGQRFTRRLGVDAVDLEQHPARLDARDPQFRRALAGAHADFGRLLRHGNVGEYADPDAACALHVAGQRAASGFDLARGDTLRLRRLQTELAERQRRARRRNAVDTALMRLPELRFLRLHHGFKPSNSCAGSGRSRIAARPATITTTTRLAFGHSLVLGHRIVLEDLTLEDPDLDAAGAEGRERGRNAVVDVRTQRVQRHATFAIPLPARDFRTAQTSRAVDPDAFRAE